MSEKVIIKVNEGQIRGIKEISEYSGTPYYAFYGIPYAEPPVKNLRFKDPVKVKKWTNIYDGMVEKSGCTQLEMLSGFGSKFWGTEDCLYNNIYTTKLPCRDEPLRPVIVNIHGGSYLTGAPHTKHYGSPNFVMQQNVVYICISYRLHILGFMNLEMEECSGNQGIKDIIMALGWIKDNVASFGGDPENITLLGCSSGAAIINLLMLSPTLDRSLFHKAVLMSGYVMNPIAPYVEANKHHASKIAESLGYLGDTDDYVRILKFLKRKSSMEIVQCLMMYQTKLPKTIAPITAMGVFSPSIDPDFLPCSPAKLIDSIMRIPIMTGCSERDAIIGFTRGAMRKETEDNFKTTFRQNCWGWGHDLKQNEIDIIEQQMQSFYTKGQPISQTSLSVKVDIQSDICQSDFCDSLVDAVANDLPSSVFVYKFDYEGKLDTIKDKGNFEERLEGTYHGSEYSYWHCFGKSPNDKETRLMVDSFTKLLASFAKNGDPNHENLQVRWKPSTPQNPCYLNINNPMQMVEGRINEERTKFWNDIKKRFKKHSSKV